MSSSSLENIERYTVYRGGYEQRSESLVGITSGPSHSSQRSVVALTRAQRERERESESEREREEKVEESKSEREWRQEGEQEPARISTDIRACRAVAQEAGGGGCWGGNAFERVYTRRGTSAHRRALG